VEFPPIRTILGFRENVKKQTIEERRKQTPERRNYTVNLEIRAQLNWRTRNPFSRVLERKKKEGYDTKSVCVWKRRRISPRNARFSWWLKSELWNFEEIFSLYNCEFLSLEDEETKGDFVIWWCFEVRESERETLLERVCVWCWALFGRRWHNWAFFQFFFFIFRFRFSDLFGYNEIN